MASMVVKSSDVVFRPAALPTTTGGVTVGPDGILEVKMAGGGEAMAVCGTVTVKWFSP